MMGERNELKNRYMIVNLPSEMAEVHTPATTRQASSYLPTPTPTPADNCWVKLYNVDETYLRLRMRLIGKTHISLYSLQSLLDCKSIN